MDDSTLTQRVSYKAKSTEISIRIEKTEENTIRVVNLHKRRAEPAREKRSIKKGPTEKPAVTEDTKKTSVKISSPYIKTEYLRMLKLESSEIQDDSRASVSTNFSPEGLNPSFHPEIKTLKKHKCHICNASFNKRYSLIRHHMVHSGEFKLILPNARVDTFVSFKANVLSCAKNAEKLSFRSQIVSATLRSMGTNIISFVMQRDVEEHFEPRRIFKVTFTSTAQIDLVS